MFTRFHDTGLLREKNRHVLLYRKDAEFHLVAACWKPPQSELEMLAVEEVVIQQFPFGIQPGGIAVIIDIQQPLMGPGNLDPVHGRLLKVGIDGLVGNSIGADYNISRASTLRYLLPFQRKFLLVSIFRRRFHEQASCLILVQKIDVPPDWFLRPERFEVLQHFPADFDLNRNTLYLLQINIPVPLCDDLRCRIFDPVNIERKHADRPRRDIHGREFHPADLDVDILLVRQAEMALMIVDEHETAVPIGPIIPPKEGVISWWNVLRIRIIRAHRRKDLRIVTHEYVEFAEKVVLRIQLPELPYRSLEIIGLDRKLVIGNIKSGLVLVHCGQFPFGIRSAVVHVIA